MSRKSPDLIVEELDGARFPDLAAAQRTALPFLAADLAATIRMLLAAGELILIDGRIIPNPDEEKNNV